MHIDPSDVAARMTCADRVERARALQELLVASFRPSDRSIIASDVSLVCNVKTSDCFSVQVLGCAREFGRSTHCG